LQFQIFTDYPAWFPLLCIVCGAAYASALYFREKKIASAAQNNIIRSFLAMSRFLVATVLAYLLLNPYIKSRLNEEEKPIIIIAQDNSLSAYDGMDTLNYKKNISDVQDILAQQYDVRYYTFGEKLTANGKTDFSEKYTDISSALADLQNTYQNLNVSGILLATDGIFNAGSNPVYVKNNLNVPYFVLALGDTTLKKDIRISRLQNNELVYLGDKFSIRCDVEAVFCNPASAKLSVTEITKPGSIVRGEQAIAINTDAFLSTFEFQIDAASPGIRHYRIAVQQLPGEVTTENNVQDIYVEVLDARQKVLLLANAPHPDIAAIKQSIETNKNYEVDVSLPADVPADIASYSIIVLHNLPSAANPIKNVITVMQQRNIPVWYISGDQTSYSSFNALQSVLQITPTGPSANQVTAIHELSFNLFTIDALLPATFTKLPPLSAVYGKYSVSPAGQVLFYQKIGSMATQYPLLVYSSPGAEKVAVLCGENFYRWRMYDYVLNNNHAATNELVNKTVQYLAAKNDKKRFRANVTNTGGVTQTVFYENEKLTFDAELYNDSYELINSPDATLIITDDDGKEFTFQFSKTTNRYILDAGFFPAGNYTFTAYTTLNGKKLEDRGAFAIAALNLEKLNTTANHKMLYQLATESNGALLYPQNSNSIAAAIERAVPAKTVLHEVIKTQSLMHYRWVCYLLLALLTLEWFMRKFTGSY
jgi:hypothetical protein